MAENREEVLSQLYALRGSISYMVERTQPIIKKEEEKCADIDKKANRYYNSSYLDMRDYDNRSFLDDGIRWYKIKKEAEGQKLPPLSNGELSYLIVTEKYKNCPYVGYDKKIEEEEDKIKKHQGEMQAEQEKNKRLRIAPWVCFATVLFGIFLMVLFIAILNNIAGYSAIGAILIVLGIIMLIYFRWKILDSDVEIANINMSIKRKQETKNKYIKQKEFIRTSKEILEKAVAELAKIREEKAELAEELRPVYYATVDAYADMVDERDWKYLDVVIYYFETKRADSIKEALQLLDRLIQTNMIVSAVQNASKDIQSCIYNATRVLAGAIETACNRICSGLNGIVSSMDMQSALISQSNMTSEQMAEDIQYIKKVFYN